MTNVRYVRNASETFGRLEGGTEWNAVYTPSNDSSR